MESLSVKYRPKIFDDVCGQDSIKKILRQQINTNNISNCMLFCGASGCGKTTLARIVANEINKGSGVPIQIDAASNNGVDNIRDLIANARLRAVDSEYKVIILDEVHALTNQAWQALLKTIEEPPAYTIFIFCTTDPQKIPDTILNRVMRFNLTRLQPELIESRLKFICQREGFTNYTESCLYISKNCNGQMRDAVSMLELISHLSTNLTIDVLYEALGLVDKSSLFKLLNFIIDGDESNMLMLLNSINDKTSNITYFVDQFLKMVFDVEKFSIFGEIGLTSMTDSDIPNLNGVVNFADAKKYYNYLINKLLDLKSMLKNSDDVFQLVQIIFLKMTRCE